MVFGCLACAARRPILAPNQHLQEMAPDAVQGDIDECIRIAKEAGPGAARGKQIAGQTAGGAAVGSAKGCFFRYLLGTSDLDPGQKRFVEDCLRQKGYNPIAWQ